MILVWYRAPALCDIQITKITCQKIALTRIALINKFPMHVEPISGQRASQHPIAKADFGIPT